MPSFSPMSLAKLGTCHPDLQRLFQEVIKNTDCVVCVGYRDEADQTEAFNTGHSKDPWPMSRHNTSPSEAVDVAPLPLDWNDLASFKRFGNTVKAVAQRLGISIVWGGDWTSFKDWDHFELGLRTSPEKSPDVS